MAPTAAASPVVSNSDSDLDNECSLVQWTLVVLPIKEQPHFKGAKKDDVVIFIQQVDKIAMSAQWTDKEWVLNMADLVGGCAAPLVRWIQTGLSVRQPINQMEVVWNLMETNGNAQTLYVAYEKLEQYGPTRRLASTSSSSG